MKEQLALEYGTELPVGVEFELRAAGVLSTIRLTQGDCVASILHRGALFTAHVLYV